MDLLIQEGQVEMVKVPMQRVYMGVVVGDKKNIRTAAQLQRIPNYYNDESTYRFALSVIGCAND